MHGEVVVQVLIVSAVGHEMRIRSIVRAHLDFSRSDKWFFRIQSPVKCTDGDSEFGCS